jgi:hypothetical protein
MRSYGLSYYLPIRFLQPTDTVNFTASAAAAATALELAGVGSFSVSDALITTAAHVAASAVRFFVVVVQM